MQLFLANAYGQVLIQLSDSAGLPYPDGEANVSLKQAVININTESLWTREAEVYEPHHIVFMNIYGEYVVKNEGNERVDLALKVPLPVLPHEESLRFVLNGVKMNYSSVEYDNPRQRGTGLHLFTLHVTLDANSENVLEVMSENRGRGSIEEDFTFTFTNASKWAVVGKITVSSEHENSLITGYSITPSRTTLRTAIWEFSSIPNDDLTIRWKVLMSPVSTQISPARGEANPLLAPIAGLVIASAVIGVIVYSRAKKRVNK